MSYSSKSFLPWYGTESYEAFGRRFISQAANVKTILDEWRVAEVKHDEAKTLYEETESTDKATMEALREESEIRRRRVAEIVERMKEMGSFLIYNDRHLWLVFRFFFMHSHRAHVALGPELDNDDKETLQFLSGEYFRVELPYGPTAVSFDDCYVSGVEVPLINWAYYEGED